MRPSSVGGAALVVSLASSLVSREALCGTIVARPTTEEFRVNQYADGIQFTPTAAQFGDGVVVAWSGQGPGQINTLIRARQLLRVGSDRDEIVVNRKFTDSHHGFPAVAGSPSGPFFVAWEDAGANDGSDHGIFGQAVGPQLSIVRRNEFPVNTVTEFTQENPDVSESGEVFAVVWNDSGQWLEPKADVKARFFGLDARPLSDELTIVPTAAGFPHSARIAGFYDNEGAFVASWTATDSKGNERILFRFVDLNGALGKPLRVAKGRRGRGRLSDVATCADGRFFVAWENNPRTGPTRILGRWFSRQGSRYDEVVHVGSQEDGRDGVPIVAMLSSCKALVGWTNDGRDGYGEGVYARVVDSSGALSQDFRVNTTVIGQQGAFYERDVAIAADPADAFIVTWLYRNPDINQHGDIMGRWFCIDSNESRSCGDATCVGDGPATTIDLNDAVLILQSAVELGSCDLCVCDIDGTGVITVMDSLLAMRAAVGLPVTLNCRPCAGYDVPP